jgi:hypothetical protein
MLSLFSTMVSLLHSAIFRLLFRKTFSRNENNMVEASGYSYYGVEDWEDCPYEQDGATRSVSQQNTHASRPRYLYAKQIPTSDSSLLRHLITAVTWLHDRTISTAAVAHIGPHLEDRRKQGFHLAPAS